MTDEERIKTEIEEWYRGQLGRRKSFKLPELANAALEHFSTQPAFAKRFVRAMARPMLYAIGANLISRTRGHIKYSKEGFVDPDQVEEALNEEVQTTMSRWRKHFENVDGRMIQIMHMRRVDDYAAAEHREGLAQTHQEVAELFRQLAEALPDDETRNGDVWTYDEIDAAYREICGDEEEAAA
jgi:hypothetical protein